MSLTELADSASALRNHMRAGVPIVETTARLRMLQPKYEEFWDKATRTIESGQPLSSALPEVWPETLVMAVIAGEHSGNLEDAYAGILDTVKLQLDQKKNLKKLRHPAVIIGIGIALFLTIMLVVVPITTKTFSGMGVKDNNYFSSLSQLIQAVAADYWMILVPGLLVGSAIGVKWLSSDEGRDAVLSWTLQLPYVGDSVRDILFGIWARYMALMVGAGISTNEALLLTSKVMPTDLRTGVLAFEYDMRVNNIGMAPAADLRSLDDDDPRQMWPYYISTAFMTAEKTGDIEEELLRVSPSLIDEAVSKFTKSVELLVQVSMIIAGLLITVSMLAIYLPVFSALSHAH